ncbi:hypothetical protein AADJ18_00205 [Erwinia amylovora]|uniref:hypothetical protein n=1 Tax=Erwinia amylovora TaxID=552 RepID=UPI0037DD5947
MDKKVYETHLTIPQPVLEKMRYHNAVQIGLAPEGCRYSLYRQRYQHVGKHRLEQHYR